MEYWVHWRKGLGAWDCADEPFESREEAEAEIEAMKADDREDGCEGEWEYWIEEREPEEDGENGESGESGELECGDYPDERSVVCAMVGGGLRVRRFASGYAREMWEIGMRESDFC